MSESDIDITDLLSDDDMDDTTLDRTSKPIIVQHTDQFELSQRSTVRVLEYSRYTPSPADIAKIMKRERPKTAKPKRTRNNNKPKVRTRPSSAINNTKSLRTAMRRVAQLQKAQAEIEKKKSKRNARYNPKQWFDNKEKKGLEDFREENYNLRSEINEHKKETTKLKSQIKLLEKQNLKRSKEIQALITVAIENNKRDESGPSTKKKKKKKSNKVYNNKQQQLLMQLRHEQSIHGSLRNKIKKLKEELKANKRFKNKSIAKKLNDAQHQINHLQAQNAQYRTKLKQQNDIIDNAIINERETLQMELGEKDQEINLMNTQMNEMMIQNDVLQKLQNESTDLQEKYKNEIFDLQQKEHEYMKVIKNHETNVCDLKQTQSECIQEQTNEINALKKETQRIESLEGEIDKLKHENATYKTYYQFMEKVFDETCTKQSENISHQIMKRIQSRWNQIGDGSQADLDALARGLTVFFDEMDKNLNDVRNELHIVKQQNNVLQQKQQEIVPNKSNEQPVSSMNDPIGETSVSETSKTDATVKDTVELCQNEADDISVGSL
eukprot:257699_1